MHTTDCPLCSDVPCDLDAERLFLGVYYILWPEVPLPRGFSVGWFLDPEYRKIAIAIHKRSQAGESPADPVKQHPVVGDHGCFSTAIRDHDEPMRNAVITTAFGGANLPVKSRAILKHYADRLRRVWSIRCEQQKLLSSFNSTVARWTRYQREVLQR